MIDKPHLAGWTPILEGEWDLAYSPLMELRRGPGLALLCTLDLEARTAPDPVADRLMLSMLRYAAAAEPREVAGVRVQAGGSDTLSLIDSEARDEASSPAERSILVVHGDASASPAVPEQRRGGGTVLYIDGGAAPSADGSYNGASPPDWPMAAGLSASDLRPRVDLTVPLLRSEAGLDVAAGGTMARRVDGGDGGADVYHLQLDPGSLDVDAQPYLRYTRWRFTRVLTQVLANLGARFPADTLSRFNDAAGGDATAAPPLYHPDYISPEADFEMSDDPYRYYRW